MDEKLSKLVKRVLYHHRTQGKAVEGVHIRGITDALRADGVEVDIISLPGADPYASPKAMSPTKQATSLMKLVARFPEPLFELTEVAYNVVAAWRVWRYLSSKGTVDFIYERYSLFMFAVVWLAKLKKIPMILEVNDSAMVERVRPLYFLRIAKAIEGWTFRNASGLVFVSSVFRDRMQAAHGTIAPAIVTPNAANIDKFTATPEQRAAARSKWGLDGKVVCGYLGAFLPWHAIDKFVFEIADQLKSRPDLVLLLVGDGSTFPEVQEFVSQRGLKEQVVLAGRVAHDDVPGLLAAMDMAILPSAGDYTSPMKLFEFMACGIAPVAPSFLPIREVLKEGVTGWTFTPGRLDEAVQMVLSKSVDTHALQSVGVAARAYIAAERQWRHNVVQLVEFVKGLQGR
ncbi:MAG: glycosyltransferase family 4 protein [Aquabacterium sp.]|uniref:glycosyltransferase family 4 protein n=1 Tax=Aquabacterium sp. TaxID=1872578 RepID=UPI0025C0E587|nr:glycosyltransferase family 4 protein [Aquabacterium sp.]MBI3382748.1 glycosyltransferase family 4 protein [Aquabacterium sp.]